MRKKIMPVLAVLSLIVIVLLVTLAANLIKKYTPTDEKADLYEVFNVTEEQVAVILQDELSEAKGITENGEVYLDIDTVNTYLNKRFYYDYNENVLIYTTPSDVIKSELGSSDYTVNKSKVSEQYQIVKIVDSVVYVAVDFIQKYTNMEYTVYESPNRIQIDYILGTRDYADVTGKTQVRCLGGIKSPILTEVKSGDKVVVLEDYDDWMLVRTEDGFIGYMKSKKLSSVYSEELTREFDEPQYTSISKDYTINLVWHQVTNNTANSQITSLLESTKGVNTVCPTWFSLSDSEGNISSLASHDYVSKMHNQGIEVWGLVGNLEYEVDTYNVLSYTSKREKLVNQIIAAAIEYDLDGVNIDFESLSYETGVHYIQFIRELSIKCRNNGIVLSIDNYVPSDYTAFYDREEQGIVADYVVIMGYDEHYAGSEEAGSVSSIGFVKSGIENTLLEVPADKIINGIPFYTRLWSETTNDDGTVSVSSEVCNMQTAAKYLSVNGTTPVWDETTGQNYGEYLTDAGVRYRVWLEDAQSIEEKMKLIYQNNLAGVASWKLGLEDSSVWDVIIKYTN